MSDEEKSMQMYKIDDGADHWVIAASVSDALAVYREFEMAPDPGDAAR